MSKPYKSLSPEEIKELILTSVEKGNLEKVRRLIQLPQVPGELLSYFAKAPTEFPFHYANDDVRENSQLALFKYFRDYAHKGEKYTGMKFQNIPRYCIEQTIRAARNHSGLPAETLKSLIEEFDYTRKNNNYLSSLLSNPTLTSETINFVYNKIMVELEGSLEKNWGTMYALTGHPNCTLYVLTKVTKNSYDKEDNIRTNGLRVRIARHPKIGIRLIEKFLVDKADVQISLAKNPFVSLSYFEPMITAFANNPKKNKIPQEIFQALISRCSDEDKREKLVRLLTIRSKDRKSRMTVAEFTQDSQVALKACYDESGDVRRATFKNPKLPREGKIVQAMMGPATKR